ncbi:CBS domain-containing protein [filamentous cyanobacterium LEGE 11480]|uniref:CBS domain-containing protein n=2 Tax=Romeriopsis TaxID=2992131 RepID=A0A928Z2X1_9CYAN|nr:CBS domain-containing protein [Romeriopsis navalis LEGE 11480]
MAHNPIVAHPEMPIAEVVQILADRHISGLPVVNQQGHLVGIVSETDLMWQETGVTPPAYIMLLDSVIYLQDPKKYQKSLHKALGQTVQDVMTPQPVTITADQPLAVAARMMNDRKVHSLPVLDDDHQLIGILTRGDIIRAMAAEMQPA